MHRLYRVSIKLLVLSALLLALSAALPVSAQTTVTPAPGLGYTFCTGGNDAAIGTIQISENVANSFPVTGGLTYFRLRLPAGFIFNSSITPTVSSTGAGDYGIAPAFEGYFNGDTEVEISYQITGLVSTDDISISGLRVQATGTGTGNIVRVASTGPEADQAGNNVGDNVSHGTLSSANFGVSLSSSDPDNQVCAGQLVTFTATPSIASGSNTYEFFNNGVSVQGPGTFSQYTSALNDNDEITVTATYAVNGCSQTILPGNGIATDVLPLPSVTAAAGPFTICGNDFADLTGTTFSNSSGIAWASSGDGSFQPNAFTANAKYYPGPNDITNGTVTLTVTTTGSACTAASDNVNIVVNALPAPVISGPASVCAGQTGVSYSTPLNAGHTYNWSITGGTITSSATSDNIIVTWGAAGTGTLQVTETITLTGCVVTTSPYDVSKNDIVVSLTSSDSDNIICSGTSVTFTATPVGAATYDFRVNGSSVQSGASNQYTTTGLSNGQSVDVLVTLATGCFATSSAIPMVVNANPVPVLTSSDADNVICSGTSVTFTATPAGQSNYQFFVDGLSVQSGVSNAYVTSGLTNGQSVRVTITNASSCTASSSSIATTVNPNPIVSLTSSDSDNIICSGTSVTFTATPVGAATYDFRVNGSSVQSGASNQYTTTGLSNGQSVDVLVTLATGCFATSSAIPMVVNANPVPVLTSSDADNVICSGTSVTFTATPAGQSNYQFFVDGLSVQSGVSNAYITSGLTNGQSVRVTITNASSCTASSSSIATTVNPNPIVSLTSSDSDNIICSGTSVTFTATPLGAATYDFRVNGSSVQSGASNQYTTTGLSNGQSVDVLVTLATGCFATSSAIPMVVNANPVPVLTSSDADNVICSGTSVTFTATPAGQSNYQFFVDGLSVQSGVSNAYVTSGLTNGQSVRVTITNASSCTASSSSITTTVNPNPIVSLTSSDSDNIICSGTSVTFTATPVGAATYDFRVNGSSVQSGASNQYTTTGLSNGQSVDVLVTLATGCFATSSAIPMVVNANPVPVLTSSDADNVICSGTSVTFTATPAGQSNYQFFVDGLSVQSGVSNAYVTSGLTNGQSVRVTITNASSCTASSSSITTTVNPNPIVSLTSSDSDNIICSGTSVTFTATPVGAATYDFRVNGSSVQSGASNQYTTTGLSNGQSVDVLVTLATGCFATSSAIPMVVNANPVPVLTSSDADNVICSGTSVTFTATPAGQSNYQFFVDGLSVQSGVSNAYVTSGLTNGQSVRVTITNASSCTASSSSITTTVNPNPIVSLTSSDSDNIICSGTSVTFTATPVGAATYDFRVNGSSVQSGASNQYTTTGLSNGQSVDVLVTLATGCFATSSAIPMVVNANPVPVLTSSDADNVICSGTSVTFTATPAGQSNYQFFVDGLSVQSGVSNAYVTSGLTNGQSVRVTITNASSCTASSSSITTTVNPNPIVSLTSSDSDNIICSGTSVTFTATPLGAATYDFRVNGSSVQSGASNQYTTTGLSNGQSVDVLVTLATGCFATSSAIPMVVNANPVPVLTSSDADNVICSGTSVTFTATPAGQSNYQFFVDGLSVQSGVSNAYVTSGLTNGQSVRVTITNASSCTASSSSIATTVNPNPIVSLTSSDSDNIICSGTSVTFTATPVGAATYDFRVNGSSVQSGASNQYTTTGLSNGQSVDVMVTLATGCFATSSAIPMVVNANPVPVLTSSDADNVICSGTSVTFTATPAGQSNYQFFVDGLSVQSGVSNAYITSGLTNGQSVRVTITNASSCTASSSSIATTVNPNPIVSLTSSDSDNIICSGTSVTFTATPLGAATYDFRVNGSSVQSGASNQYTTTGLSNGQSVDVLVTLATGCFATSSAIPMVVNANPVPVLTSSDADNVICSGTSVTFTATPAGQSNYQFFVDGLSVQSGVSNAYVTSGLTNGQSVRVTITNASSCTASSSSIATTVNPNPIVSLTSSDSDNIICSGTSVTFTATPVGAATYDFRVNGSSVQSGASNQYTTTGLSNGQSVDVLVTLATGCFATSSAIPMVVNANPVPVLTSSDADNVICSGTSVTFTATPAGQSNYQFFVDGLSVQSGVSNAYVTSGLTNGQSVRVTITNASSCTASSSSITTTVNPNPIVSLTSSDSDNIICSGTSVTFTATPVGAATYDFRVNGSSVQSGASNQYTTTGLSNGQSVDVLVTLATGCFATSSAIPMVVNANPVPVLTSSDADNVICSGTSVTFTATPAGQSNYQFFVDGLSVQSGVSNAYVTSGLTNGQSVRVTITNASSCTASSSSITTTVNPNPIVSLTSSDSDNIICSGTSVTFTATPLGAATYDFRVNGSSVQSGASNQYTTTGLSNGQSVDVLVTLATGCFATSSAIPMVVNANPVPVVTGTAIVCANQTGVTYQVTPAAGVTYAWVVNGGVITAGAGTNLIAVSWGTGSSGTVQITESITATGCSTASTPFNVTINPLPAPVITGLNAVCENQSNVSYLTANVSGHTYAWTITGGSITSGAGTNNVTVTWGTAGTGTLTVTETISATGCLFTTANYNVTINANPAPVISGPATVCANQASNVYSTTNVGGHSYSWTVSGGTITAGAGTSSITVTWGSGPSGTVQLTETIIATGCATATANYPVTINPNPVVNAIADQVACNGTTVAAITLAASTGGGETFTWIDGAPIGMPNGSDNSAPFAIPSFTATNGGTSPVTIPVKVTATKNSCTGPITIFNVTVNPSPTFTITNLTPNICEGTAANITLTSPTANAVITLISATYGSATGGTYTGGETFTTGQRINETLGNPTESPITVTYRFSVSANGCNDPVQQTTSIVINPAPPVFSIANTTPAICTGAVTNITLNTPTLNALVRLDAVTYGTATGSTLVVGSTYSTGQVIAQTLTNTTNAPTTVTYTFSVSANGCNNPVQQQTTVVVNPSPTMSISNTTASICSGTAVGITLNSPTSGAIMRLTSVNYNGVTGTLTAPQNYTPGSVITESLTNPTNNPIIVTYNFDVSANGCSTAGPFTTTVTVKPSPSFTILNASPQVCEGTQTDITLNTPTAGGQVRLDAVNYNGATGTLSAGALFTNGQKITEVLVNPTNLPITVTYTFSVSANSCNNPVQQQTTVTITRSPTVSVPADYTACQPVTIPLTGTIGASATSGLWSIVSGAGTLSATNVSGTTVTANYTVAASDIGGTVTLRLTTNDPDGPGPCGPAFDDINITINRAASITAGIDLAQCRDQASIALQGAITYAPNGVSWSGGAGAFGTITSPTSTYSFSNPSEINTNITLTLTANDPDGAGPTGPCGTVTDQMVLRVNQLPTVVFSGFGPGSPPQIAENATPITLTGNQSGGTFTISPATSSIGSTTHSPVDKVSFDPDAVELGANYVTYTYTDGNSCTNSETQEVIVNPVTDIDFTLQYASGALAGTFIPSNGTGGFDFCGEVGDVRIVGNPVASSGISPTNFTAVGANAAVLNAKISQVGPDYFINTNGLPSDNYLLQYTYTNSLGVTSAPLIRPLKVFASPVATINNLTNNCIASSILFTDGSTLPPTPFPNNPATWSYRWDFGDGQFGTMKNQPHPYSASGVYNVTLTVTTGPVQSCSGSTSMVVRVGDVPVVDFAWSAICTNDNTKFQDETDPGPVSTIDTYSWDFGDGFMISGPPGGTIPPGTNGGSTFGTFDNPEHNYSTPGSKDVVLSVVTNDGCNNSKPKTISILVSGATVTPDALSPYSNNFEVADSEWIPEGFEISTNPDVFSNSSWQFGVPAGVVINPAVDPATTSAWWTGGNANSYYASEESAVNGPCFDLRSLSRPMVTLDYWSDTEQNLDGAALQYSTDGGLNWNIVGPLASSPNEGINWYAGQTVQSNPGRQPFGSNGWTGKLTGWKNGRFNLDMIPQVERDQVRLRVAFSSNNTNDPSKTFDGFAFDNVFIGERRRNVMVEYFTNAGINASTNTYFDNLYAAQFTGPLPKDSSDFFKIQYHIANPSADPINQDNPIDPAARSLFYGISQPPSAIMDGILGNYYGTIFNGNYLLITREQLERRALEDPLFDIKLDTLSATATTVKFHTEITYTHPTLAFSSPVTVHVALVEDNVGSQRNVLRKFLLGTEGVTLNIPWTFNHTEVIDRDLEINAPVGTNNNNLYLVAFIQDKRFDSKVIHQAIKIKLNKKSQAVITGTDDPVFEQVKNLAVYPNPATRFVNFTTEAPLSRDYQYSIVDQRGITVLSGNLNRDLTIPQQVEISNLADGVYVVLISHNGRRLTQRKLAILKR